MHFTVLVIGDDPTDALEPYNEGADDPNVLKHNVSYELYYPDEDDEEEFDEEDYYNWSNIEYFDTEEEALEYTLNKGLSKYHIACRPAETIYDWYEIGGRWAGFFTLKKDYNPDNATVSTRTDYKNGTFIIKQLDGYTDSTLLSEIDFRRMLITNAWNLRKAYRLAKKLFCLIPVTENGYDMLILNSLINKTVRETPSLSEIIYNIYPDEIFLCNNEQDYINRNKGKSFTPHGLLYEDEYTNADAYLDEDNQEETWTNHIKNLLLSLPEDTRVTLVDCHI